MLKKCIKCHEIKNIDLFHKRKDSKDGYRNSCICCDNIFQNNYTKNKLKHINISEKICNVCNLLKDISEFRIDNSKKDNHMYCCKSCKQNSDLEYYNINKDVLKLRQKIFRFNHKDVSIKYRKDNIDKIKQYRIYNKEKLKINANIYNKKHYNTNKHIHSWRNLLSSTLQRLGKSKECSTIESLGYSAIELKNHIESLFTPGMSWDNRSEWHIDHIRPVSSFDKDTPVNIVCALSNLQPLWKTTRIIDGIEYIGNLNKKDTFII